MTFSDLTLVSVIVQIYSWKKCNEPMHNTNQVFDIVLFYTSHKAFHSYLKVHEDLILLSMRLVLASLPLTPDCRLLYSDLYLVINFANQHISLHLILASNIILNPNESSVLFCSYTFLRHIVSKCQWQMVEETPLAMIHICKKM